MLHAYIFRLRYIVFLCALFLLSVANTHAQTNVNGIVDTDTTWTQSESPYVVTADIQIAQGITLTVEPGARIKLFGASIIVNGAIVAQGTSQDPIYFTSSYATPIPGDWGGFYFTPNSQGIITHSVISLADNAITSVGSANLTIKDSFLESNRIAMYIDYQTSLTNEHNAAINNHLNGIVLYGSTSLQANKTLYNDLPYILYKDLIVNQNTQWTFEPGVIIKPLDDHIDLLIHGTVNIQGLPNKPITITSLADDSVGGDTNGDGQATSPTNNGWGGIIIFQDSPDIAWEYFTMAYFEGGFNILNSVDVSLEHATLINDQSNIVAVGNSTLHVKESLFQDTGGNSINMRDQSTAILEHSTFSNRNGFTEALIGFGQATITASHCIFEGNSYRNVISLFNTSRLNISYSQINYGNDGIALFDGSQATIANNAFFQNRWAIFNFLSQPVNASNNWWGDASGPFHPTLNPLGTGNKVSNNVLISPWLTSDPTQQVINTPPSLSHLGQFKTDEVSIIIEGGTLLERTVAIHGLVQDTDNDQIELQVELRPTDEPFSGIDDAGIIHAALVPSGQLPSVVQISLANGGYHWRARAVDTQGNASDWQEFGVAGNTDFIVKVKNPVLIIPGIMGTYLSKDYGDKSEIWFSINQMAFSKKDEFLGDLILESDGKENTAKPMKLTGIIRKVSVPLFSSDILDSLINELRESDYQDDKDLFILSYDWRLTNIAIAELLKEKLEEIIKETHSQKVDIIAHSMGGLVAKAYIHEHNGDFIDHLIFIGTPHLGAPKAFKALMYGDNMSIPILNEQTSKNIIQNMPSVYQLLPSKGYVDTNNHKYVTDLVTEYISAPGTKPDRELNYEKTKQLMLANGRNAMMFPLAEGLHDNLDAMQLNGIKSYNIVGCGLATIGHITATKKQGKTSKGFSITDDFKLGYTNGDETVPTISSSAQATNTTYYVNKAGHGTLPSAQGVPETIVELLNDASVPAFSHISSSSSVCEKISGDVVSSHSPVALHIYDEQRRHTGPTPDGDIEYGIPGVSYDTLGETKFAFLPEGGHYRVVNQAEDTGSYNFIIEHIQDEATANTYYYHDIPLASLQSNSEIAIVPDQTDFTIHIDQDGDHGVDTIFSPSAILDASQSLDITKPESNISLFGRKGQHGWYTSSVIAILNASDDNAGILSTKYSMNNGADWQLYGAPIILNNETSTTILYFSTDNAGNIEPIKQQAINIDKTPPEASISFNPETQDVVIEGMDALSPVTMARAANSILFTDQAGHTLTLLFSKFKEEKTAIHLKLSALYYDGMMEPLDNATIDYAWGINKKTGAFTSLTQLLNIKDELMLSAQYLSRRNITQLTIKLDDQNKQQIKLPGLEIIKFITEKGQLTYKY